MFTPADKLLILTIKRHNGSLYNEAKLVLGQSGLILIFAFEKPEIVDTKS
jgi:hypothetical protein